MHVVQNYRVVFVYRKMGLNQLQLVITVMALAFGGWWCDGCLEHEKDALLEIQTSFSYTAEELPSWGNDADCCNWKSVKCDSVTGRVVELFLPVFFTQLWKGMNPYLNVSLFLPFDELRRLDLSGHGFVGCVEDGGFERLARLHHLEDLLLERNYFNNGILTSVSGISSLKSLSFSDNALKGLISLQELNNLTNLEHLDLGHNEIEGFKSLPGDEDILKLSKLESLDLGSNCLNNNILSFINNLPSLKNLDISYNLFQGGSLEMKELDSLINLEEVDLSGNKIRTFVGSRGFNKLSTLFLNNVSTNGSSILLQSLEAFSFLQTLYLQENNFEGRPIFHPDSHSLTKLKELYLDASTLDEESLENLETTLPSLKILSLKHVMRPLSFQGPLAFKYLEELSLTGSTVNISFLQTVGTMTALKRLYLSQSSLNGTLSATQGLCNLKNIQELDFGSAGLTGTLPVCLSNLTHLKSLQLNGNNFSGPLSASLANLTSLRDLSLSGNHLFQGDFPFWLLENNRELEWLQLDNCSFSGPLRLPNQPHLNLTFLDISYNRFHGQIPEEVGIISPGLQYFEMSSNAFHGRLPSSFGNMTSLGILDLSDNSLSGEIPGSLAYGCFSLRSLGLSNNNLKGQIFSSGFSYTSLVELRLDGNQFTGTIPDGLSNLSSTLGTMDLSQNRFTGPLPVWMGNMSSLGFLDLSRNGISGSLPSRFCSVAMELVILSNNKLDGSSAGTFHGCSKLVGLDLGYNSFTGTVPTGIETMSRLSDLILRGNNLEGDLPLQLCELTKLTFIDLSHNNLSGRVLPCLRCNSNQGSDMAMVLELSTKKASYLYSGRTLYNMSGIDISFNNLTGEIPPDIGNLTDLKVLNLSYNGLTGQIPTTFSNLKLVESLDLSHNNLAGNIPPELTELNFLAVFNVAYNNLSGKILDSGQFATFENSSYEGNPFLCGPPLTRPCFPPESPKTATDNDEESGFMDMIAFKVSFLVAYFMVLLAIASVLYINPHWRQTWFYSIGVIINNCYYFLVDNLPVPSRFRYWQPCI